MSQTIILMWFGIITVVIREIKIDKGVVNIHEHFNS